MRHKIPSVYIMASKSKTLYVGVTSNLHERVWQHKYSPAPNSFSGRYNCNRLVFIGEFAQMDDAIAFEKYVKGKVRSFKIQLIEEQNPQWNDLAAKWYLD